MLSCIGKRLINHRKSLLKFEIRTFLSNAYPCQQVWEQRKEATIFKKVDYDDLYHQLDRCFLNANRISILDVDVFLNGIQGESYQNELEDVIFKLRQNPESGLLAERTMHAVVKFFIDIDKKKDLLHILSNRLNYGIFLDDFTANILMDAFLKENDATSAVKVAVLVMLQEDFSHPITRMLSIFSCYSYLKSPDVWEAPKAEEVDEDEDEIKIRVRYLRSEYFDDHFDITDTNHLVGKTLYMAGCEYSGAIGNTSKLIGLILWEKFKTAEDLLKNGGEFIDSGVELAVSFLKQRPKTEKTEEMSEEKNTLIKSLESCQKVQGDIELLVKEALLTTVKENEPKDVQKLTELYKNWEKERENNLQKELFESKKRKVIEEINKTRESLEKEEQIIFYFDKEEQWDLRVQEKEAEIRALEEHNASFKKKTKDSDVSYISPDVGQKRF